MYSLYVKHIKTIIDIGSGDKQYEIRLNRGSLLKLTSGDCINILYKSEIKVNKIIKDIRVFDTIEELVETVPNDKIKPGLDSTREIINHYKSIYNNYKKFNWIYIQL